MKTFSEICDHVIDTYEGKFSNDLNDPGGMTKWGIASKFHPEALDESFSRDDAKKIYRENYWNKVRGDYLPEPYRLLIFDASVNLGVSIASILVQRIARVNVDGIIGPRTIAGIKSRKDFHIHFTVERIRYYTERPGFNMYGNGWLRRAIEVMLESV
jgi:lysozyme family protein